MKILGKNNQFDNQPIRNNIPHKSDVNYEEKDLANSPNPSEYLGRSQVVFSGRGKRKNNCQTEDKQNFEPIKLTETPLLSKEKAIEHLRKYHFADDDIKFLDLDDKETLAQISNFKAFLSSGVINEEKDLKDFKDFMAEKSPKEKKEWLTETFSSACKYANKDNFEIFKNYINIEDSNDFYDLIYFIYKAEDCENFFEKLPLIKSVQGKLEISDLKSVFRYYNKTNYDKITPNRVNILNTINSHLPDDLKFNVGYCADIAKQEQDLTPELISKHCDLLDELYQQDLMDKATLKYNYAGDTIRSHTDKMEKVSKWLKDYPLDLKSNDDKTIPLSSFYELSQKDGEEVKTYINSLTEDAKYNGIHKFLDEKITLPKDKLSELCNILYDKSYGKIYEEKVFNFIDENKGENNENLDGIIDLIKVYKGTGELHTYHPEYRLNIANKDYKGAVQAIKLKLELDKAGKPFNDYAFNEVMFDKDADFKKFNEILTYMKDNSLNYHDYPYPNFTGEKGLNKLELRHFVKNTGLWLSTPQYEELDNLAETLENDDEKAFIKNYLFRSDKSNRIIFSTTDMQELLPIYRKHPNELTEVLTAKNQDGDIKYKRTKDSIIPLTEALALDKDYTKFLLNMKGYKGQSRFSYSGLKDIIEAHKIDPAFTNRLLSDITVYDNYGQYNYKTDNRILEKLNNNEQPDVIKDKEHINFRHSTKDIRELVDIHTIDPELTEFILDKYTDVYTDTDIIKTLVTYAQKDRELVKTLLSEKISHWDNEEKSRFTSNDIKTILDNVPEDKQFIYDLLKKTKEDYYDKNKQTPAYTTQEIKDLCKAAHIDIEVTKDLMKEKTKSANREYQRFEPSDMPNLADAAQKDKDIFYDILNQKKDGYRGEKVPRYESNDICYIMSAIELDKQVVLNLLKINENHTESNLYNSFEIQEIAKAHQENPEYVDSLLNMKRKNYKKEDVPLFNSNDIKHLVAAQKIDPEYTNYLVSKYQANKNNKYNTYNGENIQKIVNAHIIDKELTEELVEQIVIGEDNENVKRFDGDEIALIINHSKNDKEFTKYIVNNTTTQTNGNEEYTFTPDEINSLLSQNAKSENKEQNKEYLKILINNKGLRENKITTKLNVNEIVDITTNTTLEQYKNLESKVGDKIKDYCANDILTALEFEDLFNVKSINEVPLKMKKDLLRRLVSANIDLFNTSDNFKEDFPLIPKNQDEYCTLLPALVRSLGIETNTLSDKEIIDFNKTITNLSENLTHLSDDEYNNLKITQEYDKNDFIKDAFEKVKNLEPKERQKVYDYFGFELHKNSENPTGYTIVGYPVNLNNGKKLSEITNIHTKQVVEDLRKNVIKFSENNKIQCNDKNIEKELNEIVNVLPEIRTMIGRKQHSSHDFDVFKHSLKVMQKVTQDEKFKDMNDSDKKILLLATLMHDITKIEGISDGTHPQESSYDTLFISKKFKLTKDEEIKLYTLIRHHEWLSQVNTAKNTNERTKAQQSIAFDLQQNNLFDLALIFTHADLKSVKNSDLFHDKTEGDSRLDFNNERRSFGEAADFHAEKIKEYINELKKTQPLMPTTKMPKASNIEKLITKVNSDGSTNIKGVYVKEDENGKRLVVLKFNEIEDSGWEAMGLPKGSSTKGVIAHCNDGKQEYDVETGNIKFFVHGLDYPNQLAKFDAFSLLNNDALLSVSYAERPETKYRFFRAQGIMLEDSADYVYGGGNTDSGSGCGKNIDEFKTNYVFGGHREHDRKYISNLIKEATGMNDEEYVEFVEKYKNKPMIEIEPPETREKIVKAFATINSNTRKGNRQYNEMYLSNPKSVMGVFAYNWFKDEKIQNPIKFLENIDARTHFLQDYAKEHDLPFFIFGN